VIIVQTSAFAQNNARIDTLQQEINILNDRIDSLKNEIHDEILENGFSLIVKNRYSYYIPTIKLKDKEYGTVIDTIAIGDSIKIIDKTISCFKVLYNGKTGYIDTYEIETTEYPALNFLKSSYLRKSAKRDSNYSTGTGGSVNVKGYYRKDGSYVKPHTRSAPKSGGSRRR
jgi:hypothetical protein